MRNENMRLRISIVMLTAFALMMILPTPAVYAYRWNSEDNGEANVTIEWGAPYMKIAEYSPHTLKLGERCITYASSTAKGNCYRMGYWRHQMVPKRLSCWWRRRRLQHVDTDKVSSNRYNCWRRSS